MANTATTSGAVSIGASGAVPLVQVVVGSTTPTITDQVSGIILLTGTSTANIPFGGIATALLVHLKAFDDSDGTARNMGITIDNQSTDVAMPESQEFLITSKDVTKGIQPDILITALGGNDTRVEYTLAGV